MERWRRVRVGDRGRRSGDALPPRWRRPGDRPMDQTLHRCRRTGKGHAISSPASACRRRRTDQRDAMATCALLTRHAAHGRRPPAGDLRVRTAGWAHRYPHRRRATTRAHAADAATLRLDIRDTITTARARIDSLAALSLTPADWSFALAALATITAPARSPALARPGAFAPRWGPVAERYGGDRSGAS